MSEPKNFPVYDDSGCIGVLLAPARFLDSRPEKTIRLNNGEEIRVPQAALRVQPDGSFRLLRSAVSETRPEVAPAPPAPAAAAAAPAPAPEQQPRPPAQVPAGTFFQDEYEIERVAVGKVIEAPVMQRHEGETLILPVVEEVAVYQKKLYLREEIRITRRKKAVGEVRRIEQPEAKAT